MAIKRLGCGETPDADVVPTNPVLQQSEQKPIRVLIKKTVPPKTETPFKIETQQRQGANSELLYEAARVSLGNGRNSNERNSNERNSNERNSNERNVKARAAYNRCEADACSRVRKHQSWLLWAGEARGGEEEDGH